MKIDVSQIATPALTMLIGAMFVGAAAYVWTGVQTIDSRIQGNLSDIKATQAILAPKVDEIENRLAQLLTIVEPGDTLPNPPEKRPQELIDEQRVQQQLYPNHYY